MSGSCKYSLYCNRYIIGILNYKFCETSYYTPCLDNHITITIIDILLEIILYDFLYDVKKEWSYLKSGTFLDNKNLWLYIEYGNKPIHNLLIINNNTIVQKDNIYLNLKYSKLINIAPPNCLQVELNKQKGFFNLETLKFNKFPLNLSHAMCKIDNTTFCFETNTKTLKICEFVPIIPVTSNEIQSECIICLHSNNDKYALVPCGHTNICSNCLNDNIIKCPTCHTTIITKIKLFF